MYLSAEKYNELTKDLEDQISKFELNENVVVSYEARWLLLHSIEESFRGLDDWKNQPTPLDLLDANDVTLAIKKSIVSANTILKKANDILLKASSRKKPNLITLRHVLNAIHEEWCMVFPICRKN